MRILVPLAFLLLALAIPASTLAQQVTFPAPVFSGSGPGWSIRRDTRPDGKVDYTLLPPAPAPRVSGVLVLGASNAPRPGTYVLDSLQGAPWLAIAIVPFAQGEACADGGAAAGTTYRVRAATTKAFVLDGCGGFTQ